MEIQEFAPHMLLGQLVFKTPTPAVIDQRGALMALLQQEFGASEGNAELSAVEAFSEDRRNQWRIGTAQVMASSENFDEIDVAGDEIGRFAKLALTRLDRPTIGLVRARTYDLAATASFDELRDALSAAFGAPRGVLAEIVGQPMSDVGWVYEFTDGQPNVTLRFGPMKASQMKAFVRDDRDSQYPGEFLFLDVDFAHPAQDLDSDQAIERLQHAIDSNRKVVRRVSDWLKEKLAQ
jgi:hypothetical protein